MSQRITIGKFGATAERVLDALTPLMGEGAPGVNANFIGQHYIDTTGLMVYVSVAVASETPADDWVVLDKTDDAASVAAVAASVAALVPLTGVAAPAAQAAFVGQIFIDTVLVKAYISIANDSVSPADDWKEITFASAE